MLGPLVLAALAISLWVTDPSQGGYTTANATDHIITFPLSVSSWRVPVILPFALSQVAYIHDPDNIGAHDGFHARLSVATLCYWIVAGK